MITEARIREELRGVEGLEWIRSLRSPQIRKLVTDSMLQPSLFDEVDLAEIHHPSFPGERRLTDLASRGEQRVLSQSRYCVGGPAATECRTSTEAKTSSQDLNSHGCLPVNTRSSFLRITPWPSTRNARLISSQHFDGETNRHADRPDAASIRRGLQ